MLERLRVAFTLFALCFAASACGGSSPTAPSAPSTPTVNGTWKGTGTDFSEGSEFTCLLTQNASNITGTSTFVGVRSSFNANGPVTGTVSGLTFTFVFTVTFAPPFQFCTATASGFAQITNTSMAGNYTGTSGGGTGDIRSLSSEPSRGRRTSDHAGRTRGVCRGTPSIPPRRGVPVNGERAV